MKAHTIALCFVGLLLASVVGVPMSIVRRRRPKPRAWSEEVRARNRLSATLEQETEYDAGWPKDRAA